MTFFVPIGTFKFFRLVRAVVFGALFFFLTVAFARAQSPDAVNDLAARINRERIARGLIPYALNAQLNSAAQAHANDIARMGRYSHIGSDGSTVSDRVGRAGYGAYSWGCRLGENWAWYHDAATAMQMWMVSPPHRGNILHAAYREFGIGIAPAEKGGFIYVVNFGAQPNVLPIFIQNGASNTTSGNVTLALSNEDYATNGDGTNRIGQAKEVQISSSPNFTGARWQAFASRFAWTLPAGEGTKTVYVKFRDVRGRTVTSNDSINLNKSSALAPMAAPSPTSKPTPKPSPTNTKPRLTATPASSPSPSALPTEVTDAAEPRSTATTASAPSIMPTATETETPTLGVSTFVLTETPSPAAEAQIMMTAIEPLPTVAPASAETLSPDQVSPIALGIFGVSLILGILSAFKYFANRTDYD